MPEKKRNNENEVLETLGLAPLKALLSDPDYKDHQAEIKAALASAAEAADLRQRQIKVFETLSAIDVTKYVQLLEQGGKSLKYLSWASAIKIVRPIYPFMEWKVLEFTDPNDGYVHQYRKDPETGNYTVYTEVTIEGITIGENLPIMDQNYACRKEGYRVKTKYREIYVRPIDGMLVNKTIRRCLVKNLASFGLGLDLYIGDDLPFAEEDEPAPQQPQKASAPVQQAAAPKPKAEKPKEPAQPAPAKQPVPTTIEEALAYHIEGNSVSGIDGKTFYDLAKTLNEQRFTGMLKYCQGTKHKMASDAAACRIIQEAIKEGKITYAGLKSGDAFAQKDEGKAAEQEQLELPTSIIV